MICKECGYSFKEDDDYYIIKNGDVLCCDCIDDYLECIKNDIHCIYEPLKEKADMEYEDLTSIEQELKWQRQTSADIKY